jgi:hypothetical protein
MLRIDRLPSLLCIVVGTACGVGTSGTGGLSGAEGTSDTSGGSSQATTVASDDDGGGADSSSNGDALFDVAGGEGGGPGDACAVGDDMNAVGGCELSAPPDAFEPDVQWTWMGDSGDVLAYVMPLVANLTDDNGDGRIDVCDVPDVVIIASPVLEGPGHIYVLDGATGSLHLRFETAVSNLVTPALGDIDGDGLVEIVTAEPGTEGHLMAFEHTGELAWTSDLTARYQTNEESVALGDVDNDGDVEISFGDTMFDHTGHRLWDLGINMWSKTAVLADLDDDDDLEVIMDHRVVHHDGTPMWQGPADLVDTAWQGYPQVANLDDDPQPEVLFTCYYGITMFEHDGTVKWHSLRPTGDQPTSSTWRRPATVHDFDGDGQAEFAMSSNHHYSVFEGDGTVVWSASVLDSSGVAAGTAFDFLGDGTAEAMYADEVSNLVFGSAGQVLLQTPRTSRTGIEYPVVADVDNDGSAEIIVVSSDSFYGDDLSPTVQVIRDVEDRWIQARRIWNQHTYHVTNVREDGTIPQVEPHHWELLNTFRTNAQIENGGLCMPEPAG